VVFQNNGYLNRMLELTGVGYGPHSTPASVEVLKKRKVEVTGKVLVKCPKAPENKGTEPAKVSGAHAKGGLRWPSDADIMAAKSMKLSKGIVPCTIASVVAVRITPKACSLVNSFGASGSNISGRDPGSKIGGRDPSSKTVPEAKKATPSAKKPIIPVIGDLAMISSEWTQESKPHDQAPEVLLKAGLHGRSPECRV
jgi:hypothetical protein